MKKILITGGAGFIGSNLAKELQRRFPSVSIVVFDNFSSGIVGNLLGFEGKMLYGNVEDKKRVESLEGKGFDCIFHLAAITDTTILDEDKMMRVNVDGFKNVLNLAIHEQIPLVYASSAGVYGSGDVPMKESQELFPLNPYSVSKVKMDEMIRLFNGFKIMGLRFFNVYGHGEHYKGKSASMVLQLMGQMIDGKRPRIFEYGEQDRDFIHVNDVVTALISAMDILRKKELKKNVVINVGTGVATSFNRVVEILNKVLGKSLKPVYFKNPYSFYQNHTLADMTLTAKTIGFKAKYSIEDGIRDYFEKADLTE